MIEDQRSICFLFWKEVLLGIAGATRKGVDTQDASMLLCTGLGRRLMIARDLQLSCRMYPRGLERYDAVIWTTSMEVLCRSEGVLQKVKFK